MIITYSLKIGIFPFMRYTLFILFSALPFFSEAQISGQVIGTDGMPVNFATVYNMKTKTGCVSDSVGFFKIAASLTDSIRIHHLSYQTGIFVIGKNLDQYKLSSSLNEIKEIIVSKAYAGRLAVESCRKAISRMQYEPRDRMYCNAVKTMNKDTLDQIFLDLDFERNQSGNSKEPVIHNRLIEIQRFCQQFNQDPNPTAEKVFLAEIFPEKGLPVVKEAGAKEIAMNDDCIFYILTDSEYIRIQFIPKKEAPIFRPVFELTISKEDTCLVAFAMATFPLPFVSSKNFENKPEKSDYALYYKISYENKLGYLSRIYRETGLYYAVDSRKYSNKFSFDLNNYAHNSGKQKKRSGRWIIDNRFGFMNKPKSTNTDEFWKKDDFPHEAPYDFNKLRALKQHVSDLD